MNMLAFVYDGSMKVTRRLVSGLTLLAALSRSEVANAAPLDDCITLTYEGKYTEAITCYENAEVSPKAQATRAIQLARTHWLAYKIDNDDRHLEKIMEMAREFGDSNWELIANVIDELKAKERDKEQADAARRQAEADRTTAEAARIEAEKQAVEADRAKIEAEKATIEAERQAKQDLAEQKLIAKRTATRAAVGGAMVSFGAALVGLMGYGLAQGEQVERAGMEVPTTDADSNALDSEFEQLDELDHRGRNFNTMVYATSAVGGALLIAGTLLIVQSAVKRGKIKEGRRQARVRVDPRTFALHF